MLDDAQVDTFNRLGAIKVNNLLPDFVVTPLYHKIRKQMIHTGALVDDHWTRENRDRWQTTRIKKIREPLKKSKALMDIVTPEVLATVNTLVPGAAEVPGFKPQLLLTPPNSDHWVLPRDVWHIDLARSGNKETPGVQMFACINYIEPSGGGTLIAGGSHHFVNDAGYVRSKQLKKRLKRYSYFNKLFNGEADAKSYMAPQEVDGVTCEILELTGAPGDVWFTDLRMLHTLSFNITERPRLAVTQRFFTKDSIELMELHSQQHR